MGSETGVLEHGEAPLPDLSGAERPREIAFEWVAGGTVPKGLADEWDALVEGCPRSSLCAHRAWVEAWWGAFGGQSQGAGRDTALLLGIARDERRRLVGVIPLFEERTKGQVRRLRSVGFLGREGVYDMTEEPAVLLRPGDEADVLRAFAEALRPHLRRGRWDLVFFRLMSDDALPLEDAFAPLRSGAWIKCERKAGPHVATMPSTWSAYRRELTKSMRDNLGYYPRLLTRRGHDWSVRTVREPQAIREAAARLAELHGARSTQGRGQGHANHIHGSVQCEFFATLMERMAAEDKGFIAELVVDGEVVASQAFLEGGDELMVYYSGYREAWYDFSPVFVIDAAVFGEAQARGVRRLNFLTARAAWKTRWGAAPGRSIHRVFAVPLRPDCVARALAYILGILWTRDVVGRIPRLHRKAKERLMKWRAAL